MRASLPLFAVAVLSVFIGLSSHLAFAQQAPTLAGSEWRLEQCDGQPVPTDAVVTLTFEEGRVSGRAAVNRYFAAYTVAGEALTFGEAGSTKMAGPQHLMAVETAYLAALKAVQTYSLADQKLALRDAAGADRLVFTRSSTEVEVIDPGAPLHLEEGQLWVPLRSIATWLGATVDWDGAASTASAVVGDRRFTVDARRNVAQGDGRRWTARHRMMRPSGMVYVPLEALAESLGAKVIVQPDDHVLIITSNDKRGALSAP